MKFCLRKLPKTLNKLIYIYVILTIAALTSCNLINNEKGQSEPIARVYDTFLFPEDIEGIVSSQLSERDSLLLVQNYVDRWAKEQLIIKKAEFNLPEEVMNYEELVNQYRNDLIKFAYQQQYVEEHLDTLISFEEIKEYYGDYPQNFELKENILRADYYIFDINSPDISKVKYWFKSSSKTYQAKFVEYSNEYALVDISNDTNWIPFDELTKTIPIQTYNQQQFLAKNVNVVVEDSMHNYFLRIREYKIKDDVSPLPYVTSTVHNIILNQRKLALIRQMEDDIVNDAYEKKNIEIY